MKKIFTPIIICLFVFLLQVSGIQACNDADSTIITYDFNTVLATRDSVVTGIEGSAIYFSKQKGFKGLQITEHKEKLSELWKAKDFTVEVWVQTTASNEDFQVIASNKDWDSGDVKDFTDNRYFGRSRTSGINKGWAIVCQPDGSWAWNIGNGKADGAEERVESFRKDYRPTAPRQQINDGAWHQIAFTVNRESNEARLYFDGKNVAIYYLGPVRNFDSGYPISLANGGRASEITPSFEGAIDELNVYNRVLNKEEITARYKKFIPVAKQPQLFSQRVNHLNLMTWNIWHGGRRHGRDIGPKQVIDFIKDTNTDIVMMQETYGSGPLIADALGYYFYLASENISVISKYPIEETRVAYHELWSGITRIRLSQNQCINLASIWLHYLPAWGSDYRKKDATAQKLIVGEGETRHKEIKIILNSLKNEIQQANEVPLLIGGDFNSPSHLDWVECNREWHQDLVIEWPVSKEMENAGFKDSFRELNPDLTTAMSTIKARDLTFRIDYIYYKGQSIKAVESEMHFRYKGIWPSDHPAVTTSFKLN